MRTFGDHLRRWRRERSLSQLALAALADTSARHLSFLESGRSTPGREMVLRLAAALEVTPAERDRALEAAGLPPLCRRPAPAAADADAMRRAIESLVERHDPLPALVLDADWRLVGANRGGERLLATLAGSDCPRRTLAAVARGEATPPSLIDLVVAEGGDDGAILNWMEVARHILARGRAELVRREGFPPLADALARLDEAYARRRAESGTSPATRGAGSGRDADVAPGEGDGDGDAVTTPVIVPLRVRAPETVLTLVSMIAQFGGIDYVDVDAPMVELMFAADEATERWFEEATEAVTAADDGAGARVPIDVPAPAGGAGARPNASRPPA